MWTVNERIVDKFVQIRSTNTTRMGELVSSLVTISTIEFTCHKLYVSSKTLDKKRVNFERTEFM